MCLPPTAGVAAGLAVRDSITAVGAAVGSQQVAHGIPGQAHHDDRRDGYQRHSFKAHLRLPLSIFPPMANVGSSAGGWFGRRSSGWRAVDRHPCLKGTNCQAPSLSTARSSASKARTPLTRLNCRPASGFRPMTASPSFGPRNSFGTKPSNPAFPRTGGSRFGSLRAFLVGLSERGVQPFSLGA